MPAGLGAGQKKDRLTTSARNARAHCQCACRKLNVRMTSVRKAAGAAKEGAEVATALLLSQPRITGTSSSRKFDNPWPEWEVCVEHICFAALL